MNSAISLLGVLLGGIIGITGTFLTKYFDGRRERRALRMGLAGEIRAILEVVKEREYLEKVGLSIARADQHKNFTITMHANVTFNYFTIYESNAEKIGLLPEEAARRVASFYTFSKSIVEDLKNDREIADPVAARDLLLNMQRFLKKLNEMGEAAIVELEKV